MTEKMLEQRIDGIIRPAIAQAGYRLVQVRLLTENSGLVLRVLAEDPKTRNLGVEDCKKLSKEISPLLDVEDPINGAYRLEISSPGIDRPLVSLEDFNDFKGFEAKVEIDPPLNGQKRFRGLVKGVDGDMVLLETEDQGAVTLPFDVVQKAKLVLTDDLIKSNKKDSLTA